MSNIEQNLQHILGSKYGKDVRQAIHDSIHDCYEDGKAGATDLIAREQIANLVSMNNPTEGNSELQDIRVGFDGTTYESAGEAVRKQSNEALRNYGIIDSDADFNDLKECRVYFASSPNEHLNSPTGGSGWLIPFWNRSTLETATIFWQLFFSYVDGTQYIRYFQNGEWSEWVTSDLYNLRSLESSKEEAEKYENLLSNIPAQTMMWISTNWYTDAIENGGTGWIFTFGHRTGNITYGYGTQLFYNPFSKKTFQRLFDYTTKTWSDWEDVDIDKNVIINSGPQDTNVDFDTYVENGIFYFPRPNTNIHAPVDNTAGIMTVLYNNSVITQTFVDIFTSIMYTRYRLDGEWTKWYNSGNRKSGAKYYAFGDSTTYGQIANVGGQSPYNYPACVGRLLNMEVSNKGVGGQGLLKDWDTIQTDYIEALDMSDAELITVGWAYNDNSEYASINMGSYRDTTEETVIGKYFTIMKQFQKKCPNAMVILITGYGLTLVGSQFTGSYTFLDGQHTVKEFYDELEKMCHLHGWPCINQAKGTWVNEYNWTTMIGDNIHPTKEAYRNYANFIVGKISSIFSNVINWVS